METCRTCAKCDFENATTWLDPFHPIGRWEHAFEQIRVEFTNWQLEISQNDGLPQKICSDCFAKFCTVYTFRLQVQDAQNRLSNIFARIDTPSLDETVHTLKLGLEEAQSCEAVDFEAGREEATLLHTLRLKRCQAIEHVATLKEAVNPSQSPKLKEKALTRPLDRTKSKVSANTTNTSYTAISACEASAIDEKVTPSLSACSEELDDSKGDKLERKSSIVDGNFKANAHFVRIINSEDDPVSIEDHFNPNSDVDNQHHREATTNHNESYQSDTNVNTTNETTANNHISFVFECKYCYKNKGTSAEHYHTQEALLAHITAVHNCVNPYKCPHCEQGFQDAASRTVHMRHVHVAKHYNCEVCGKKYADRFNLRHHFEKYHCDTDFECDLCQKRFYSRKSLNYHKKWHNPARQLQCRFCDRLFINQRHLQCHEVTHTGVRNAEYCSFCGKSFIHLKTLRWHIYRQHGGAKPFKCGSCSEVFASYHSKRVHMLEHHLENLTSLERTECMLCHRRFETDADLKAHMTQEQHSGGGESSTTATISSATPSIASVRRPSASIIIANNKRVVQDKRAKRYSGIFQCDVCSQRFNMKSSLERHAAVHSTEGRPHGCPQCQKRFKRVQDLNWHMKTHSNEKPNVCDVCGKGFALKYVLNQHKRSHEVLEKNFVCATCGRAYLFEKSLRVHERTHTGKTYYKCDLCSESFVTHIKFKCHMRNMHVD